MQKFPHLNTFLNLYKPFINSDLKMPVKKANPKPKKKAGKK